MTTLPRRQRGSTRDPVKFRKRLERLIANKALPLARRRIDSRTLRKGLHAREDAKGDRWVLRVPHYWALYYHDGHGGRTRTQGFYLYFLDPREDPRTSYGKRYPTRFKDTRSLRDVITDEEFKAILRENERRRKTGKPPKAVITRRLHDMRAHPFFEKLDLHRNEEISRLGVEEFREWMLPQIPTDYGIAAGKLG